jgi:glucose-1-phosphate cytidylyltransferase
MKVAILAGGLGSRMNEQSQTKPKAMAEIGGQPILWHIIKYYHHWGFNEFVVALGHLGSAISDHFREIYTEIPRDDPASQQLRNGSIDLTLVDTGPNTENGGRIKRLAPYLKGQTFMLTWCDGLADVDLRELVQFHKAHGRAATLTAVHPPGRFGRLTMEKDRIVAFDEKTIFEDEWINGAFFVLEPKVLDYIDGDSTQFEQDTLRRLAAEGELMGYRHNSFWQCMDTVKEQRALDAMWRNDSAPWKVWE